MALSKTFVYVVFTRMQESDGKPEILLKSRYCSLQQITRVMCDIYLRWQSKNGDAGSEWVLAGGELLPDEVVGFTSKDINIKYKSLQLAAVRTAALDLGHCSDMPETDFESLGGKKERLPPSLLHVKRFVKGVESVKGGKTSTFAYVCILDPAVDSAYATNKWKPCGAAAQNPDCKWFALADLQNPANQQTLGLPPWVPQLLEKAQERLVPLKNAPRPQGAQATPPQPNSGGVVGVNNVAHNSSMQQPYNKQQGGKNVGPAAGNGYEQGGNMMQNAYVPDMGAVAAYPPQQHFAPNYMAPNYMMPPQMEIQQSSLKFKFPAHIISLVVRTTGCRLRDDQVVSIGAAFVKIPNQNTVPINLKHELFQCKVDAQVQLDSEYMSSDELRTLQAQAKSPKQAIEAALAFVQDCIRQDASSYIAAQNPMVELGMLELAAATHCQGFTSLSHLAGAAGGGDRVKAPIDLGSFACGLVSTDGKAGGNKAGTSKAVANGRPWATLSEYLQQHLNAAAEFDKHLPFPKKVSGRLEPHEEAVNNGWHFCNTLCVLADKHQKAMVGMGMGMVGMPNNPAMQMQMLYMQQQQQQIMQWQQQQMMVHYQNYGAQQSAHPHNRMQPHNKQSRQHSYNHNAGRGAGGYQGGPVAQGMGMSPHVPGTLGQYGYRGPNMPAFDASQSPKAGMGAPDAMPAPMPVGATPPTTFEAQPPPQAPQNGTKQQDPRPRTEDAQTAVAAPAVADVSKAGAGQVTVQAARHAVAAPAPQKTSDETGAKAAAPQQQDKSLTGGGKENAKKAGDASDAAAAAKPKQEGPKSWAQMASKPPQPQTRPQPAAPAAAAPAIVMPSAGAGHAENGSSGGVATAATEGSKDAGKRESAAEGSEQKAHRRESGQGRGEGGRKDDGQGGERGGRGKGNSGGGPPREGGVKVEGGGRGGGVGGKGVNAT